MTSRLENTFELLNWPNKKLVIGIDEAGRGPIAGPLVVSGVILPLGYLNDEVYDSKQCSAKKRESLYDVIIKDALAYHIEVVSEQEIDELNIYKATQKAMHTIADALDAEVVLSDAMPLPFCKKEVHAIIKGDQKSISIAAASIVAKVTRDRIMMQYDQLFPQYDFKNNKGYPTKKHIASLEEFGITNIHRKSYGPVSKLAQMKLDL